MKTEARYTTETISMEEIREVFKRIREIQLELKKLDADLYLKFKDQNAQISELEFYNLKKVMKNKDYESFDTLEMRISLLRKWECELERIKSK